VLSLAAKIGFSFQGIKALCEYELMHTSRDIAQSL
jgi:hypothetical protein